MSSFIINSISPVIGAMVSSDKGDLSNRTECAVEHMKNNFKYNTANLLIMGGGAYTGYKVLKKPALYKKALKFVNKITEKIATKAPKIAEKLTKLPGKAKVLGLIAAPILLAVGYLATKGTYEMGKIDQKYEDIARRKNFVQEFYKNGGKGVRFE